MKLKGGDAVIYRALKAVRAKVTFRYLYYERYIGKDVVLAGESRVLETRPPVLPRDPISGG
jgi:hypothetical protein